MHAQSLQSCPTLCDPVDCSLPGPPVQGILQARLLEWVVMPFSRGSSRPRSGTQSPGSPALAGRFFSATTTWEAPGFGGHLGLLYTKWGHRGRNGGRPAQDLRSCAPGGGALVPQSCLTLVTLWPVTCRLLCPWDSPGKNTGVGCHFLHQGYVPHSGIKPGSPASLVDSLPSGSEFL